MYIYFDKLHHGFLISSLVYQPLQGGHIFYTCVWFIFQKNHKCSEDDKTTAKRKRTSWQVKIVIME